MGPFSPGPCSTSTDAGGLEGRLDMTGKLGAGRDDRGSTAHDENDIITHILLS